MYSAKCFLEVINSVGGNDSVAEMILCNVTLKLRGLKFKMVTFGGNGRGRGYSFICVYINETMKYFSRQLYPMVASLHLSIFAGLFSPQLYPMVASLHLSIFAHSSTPWWRLYTCLSLPTALPHGGVSPPVYLCPQLYPMVVSLHLSIFARIILQNPVFFWRFIEQLSNELGQSVSSEGWFLKCNRNIICGGLIV